MGIFNNRPNPPLPPRHSIGVLVLDDTGHGVAGATVILVNVTPTPTYGREQTTDTLGWTTFVGLPAGTTRIQVAIHAEGFIEQNVAETVPDRDFNLVFGPTGSAGESDVLLPPLMRIVSVLTRLHRDGVDLVNDKGRLIWFGASAFRLAEMASDGVAIGPYLDWCMLNGINIVRVFAMCKNMFVLLPAAGRKGMETVLLEAAKRGLYVEVVALADTVFYPQEKLTLHVQQLGELCAKHENSVLELCNEPMQSWQKFTPAQLTECIPLLPTEVPVCLGAADGSNDESRAYITSDIDYVTVHCDRNRKPWGNVRHIREQQVIRDEFKIPVINDEPMRDLTEAQYFAVGALCRVLGIGDTLHSDFGKMCRFPSTVEQGEVDARKRGWNSIPRDWVGRFTNFGWKSPLPEHPVESFKSNDTDSRAYASTTGSIAYVVLLNSRDPVFRLGWTGLLIDSLGDASVWKCEQ